MEVDPARVCELLVGLGDVEVLGVDDEAGEPLGVHVRRRAPRPGYESCGRPLWSDGERLVVLADLPAFGRLARLVWHKRRWRCASSECAAGTVTEQDCEIGPPRSALTTRAGRWATVAVGRDGRTVADVAAVLGCDWHTANDAVTCWGEALLAADVARVGSVEALGLDETLFGRQGPRRHRGWSTQIVDVNSGRLARCCGGPRR